MPHSKDNVASNNKNISDVENLTSSFEENFVHNCEIVYATSNITFYNNNNKNMQQPQNNKIITTFAIKYKNNPVEFHDAVNNTEISNVKLSNDFCKSAVGYYNDVNNYTDSQQIEDKAKKASFHSGAIKFYLYAMLALLFVNFVAIFLVWRYKSKYDYYKSQYEFNDDEWWQAAGANKTIIAFAILLAFGVILFVTWHCTIDAPINEHVENITK